MGSELLVNLIFTRHFWSIVSGHEQMTVLQLSQKIPVSKELISIMLCCAHYIIIAQNV